ncbi:MAG: hypothetical protein Q4G54_10410 [Pelistega sp.]|nr:hypothetical protein [Pelistega sp.]
MNSYTSALASLPSDKTTTNLSAGKSSSASSHSTSSQLRTSDRQTSPRASLPASSTLAQPSNPAPSVDKRTSALRFPAHPGSATNALSTPYDTLNTASDTAVIVIGSEHTRYYKQQHKLFISTADAIVTSDQAPIFNIEILRAAQRLSKSQRHLRIVTHDSSRAAQLLYHRLQNLIH